MANLTETTENILTKSITEGFKDFGRIEEVSDIPMKNSESEAFNARGFQTSKCFVMFSKKLVDKFEGQDSKSILKNVINDQRSYQFAAKPGVTWKTGEPIWVLTLAGGNHIQRATQAEVNDLNAMLGM